MDDYIEISKLNDFLFCPISIYFHGLYGNTDVILYQCSDQIKGTIAHNAVDTGKYSSRKDILQGIYVCSEKYRLIGKIDTFNTSSGVLKERKNKISVVFDGYIMQLYAQYYALKEMGYSIQKLQLYSISDCKIYPIFLPEEDNVMFEKFEQLIYDIQNFDMEAFEQVNIKKCQKCIYESVCDRSLL